MRDCCELLWRKDINSWLLPGTLVSFLRTLTCFQKSHFMNFDAWKWNSSILFRSIKYGYPCKIWPSACLHDTTSWCTPQYLLHWIVHSNSTCLWYHSSGDAFHLLSGAHSSDHSKRHFLLLVIGDHSKFKTNLICVLSGVVKFPWRIMGRAWVTQVLRVAHIPVLSCLVLKWGTTSNLGRKVIQSEMKITDEVGSGSGKC